MFESGPCSIMSRDLLPGYWNSTTDRQGTRCEIVKLYVQAYGVLSSLRARMPFGAEPRPGVPSDREKSLKFCQPTQQPQVVVRVWTFSGAL